MDHPADAMTHDDERRKRSNVRLALLHVALALGLLAAFVWVQAHR